MYTRFIGIDTSKHNTTNSKAINIGLVNLDIYTILIFFHQVLVNIFNIADITSIIVDRKTVYLSVSSTVKSDEILLKK